MDFIVVCPHCGAYVGIDRHSFHDVDYYNGSNGFSANGYLYCDACEEESILDIFFEIADYRVSKEVH